MIRILDGEALVHAAGHAIRWRLVEQSLMGERITDAVEATMPADDHRQTMQTTGCIFVVGAFVCLLIPVVGPFLFVIALGVAIWGMFKDKPPRTLNGSCPFCATDIHIRADVAGADCPACSKRVVLRGHQFVGIEP